MNGDEYTVSDKEAKAAVIAMDRKAPLNLVYAVINGSGILSVSNEAEASIKMNKIINDEDFKAWLSGNDRRIDSLNNRYPGDKFEKEWKEAMDYKKSLESQDLLAATNDR